VHDYVRQAETAAAPPSSLLLWGATGFADKIVEAELEAQGLEDA